MHTKFIFVTGGVVSSLGKGITAASLGRLLKSRGLRVSMQKFDPYINVDPGTMSPYQHGEVFVTDDGAETDLDLGHYERFIDENLTQAANVTSGRVYDTVITRERKGEYLGATIQVIPHITNEIKRRMLEVSLGEDAPEHRCAAPDGAQGYRFSKAMKNPGFIGAADIRDIYLPMGFSHFKIEGRSLGSALILEFLLSYLTKPEYQLRVREEIYLDNMLDLF